MINGFMSKPANTQLPVFYLQSENPICYLPIEALRTGLAHGLFQGEQVFRMFVSSGTTQRDKSISLYSSDGLTAYQHRSVSHFLAVLDEVQPAVRGRRRLGISLIPPPTRWTESSLAQMLGWISEKTEVKFAAEDELNQILSGLGSEPVWLFGTAFHLINAVDSGITTPLPKGSIIFETGGTKGRSREVARDRFYTEIAAAFGVSTDAIVSEYGMSELACQAYDYVPHGQTIALAERRFRFDPAVSVCVLDKPGLGRVHGRGALIVSDPLRTDYPWPLRTEDLVELSESGFRLLGRTPIAPLKGCSLHAESLSGPEQTISQKWRPDISTTDRIETAETPCSVSKNERVQLIDEMLKSFLGSAEPLAALAHEIKSHSAAREAIADIRACIPQSLLDWLAAAEKSTRHQDKNTKWLFILPDNHSVVGLYPLSLAYILGWEVRVRLPRRFHPSHSFISLFIAQLGTLPGSQISLLPPGWRLQKGASDLPNQQRILAYGSTETIKLLQDTTQNPVQGFGHRLGVSVLHLDEVRELARQLARDALSLGQSGCLSTRLIVAVTPHSSTIKVTDAISEIQSAAEALKKACEEYWQALIPWRARVCLDSEAFRLSQFGAVALPMGNEGSPLVTWVDASEERFTWEFDLDRYVAKSHFSVPLLVVGNCSLVDASIAIARRLQNSGNFGILTTPEKWVDQVKDKIHSADLPHTKVRSIGTANRPIWDGLHEGQALFESGD